MTSSSKRATGHAAVRATPAAQVAAAGAWFLDELTDPRTPGAGSRAAQTAAAQLSAEERARLIDEGYARGLADGEAKARATAQAHIRDAMAAVRAAAARLDELATLAPAVLEENIAVLAVVVARQIVAREVSLDREIVPNLVRRALTEFPIDQAVRIRVNPLDLSVLTSGAGDDTVPITGGREASWLADPTVSRGGCLVEGRDRIVDGRVDHALERVYRRMAQVDAS
jgi:flagellar biosynthesis/type III secretory pathway protein FliH